jgi:hypothetical protein
VLVGITMEKEETRRKIKINGQQAEIKRERNRKDERWYMGTEIHGFYTSYLYR